MIPSPFEADAIASLSRLMKCVVALFECLKDLEGHEATLDRLFGRSEMNLLRSTVQQGLHRVVGGAEDTQAIFEIWRRYDEINRRLAVSENESLGRIMEGPNGLAQDASRPD